MKRKRKLKHSSMKNVSWKTKFQFHAKIPTLSLSAALRGKLFSVLRSRAHSNNNNNSNRRIKNMVNEARKTRTQNNNDSSR